MGIIKWNGPILMGVQKKKGTFFFLWRSARLYFSSSGSQRTKQNIVK